MHFSGKTVNKIYSTTGPGTKIYIVCRAVVFVNEKKHTEMNVKGREGAVLTCTAGGLKGAQMARS